MKRTRRKTAFFIPDQAQIERRDRIQTANHKSYNFQILSLDEFDWPEQLVMSNATNLRIHNSELKATKY